jgi:hypothetical protein
MLANSRHHERARRGIVLVLVLAVLGLLALIGITFATYSGQAKINARNFYLSVLQPQDDELMDFALSQLINDTGDVRSVIRGHSLARDMYGTNINNANGYLTVNPVTGGPFLITAIQAVPAPNPNNLYDVLTNIPIPANAPALFGYNFTRWIMRFSVPGSAAPRAPDQTLEIVIDDFAPNGTLTTFSGQGFHAFRVSPVDTVTTLNNPTAAVQNNLPAWQLSLADPSKNPFILDGRWLHAFNGTGMGANAVLGNFRYNGLLPGAMDEDYDACDLENWFLAIQSADGQVIIPSFHRPGIIRYDPTNANVPVNDWARINVDGAGGTSVWASSASRILRPVKADGHDQVAFPDLTPDSTTGKIKYDVDNDGDGITDSVWLDLGYPARRDSRGQLYKPMFAFMVIGLNGRIPLNTAGNLASQDLTSGIPTLSQAEHLGNSVSEVDPTYVLQNAFNRYNAVTNTTGDYDPYNTLPNPNSPGGTGWSWPPYSPAAAGLPQMTSNTQVDNAYLLAAGGGYYTDTVMNQAGIDVRLTQLRNLLAGTRPQPKFTQPDTTGSINGDTNSVFGAWPGVGAGQRGFLPNGMGDVSDTPSPAGYTDGTNPLIVRVSTPTGGRWGEAASVPGIPFANPAGPPNPPFNLVRWGQYTNPVRAGYSFDVTDLLNTEAYTYTAGNGTAFARDAADDNYNAFDPFPVVNGLNGGPKNGEINDLDYYDSAGALLLPVERMRRFVTPVDINGTGTVRMWNTATGGTPPTIRGPDLGPDNFGRVQFASYFRPGGIPGLLSVKYTNPVANPPTLTASAGTLGAIYFPSDPNAPNPLAGADPFYAGTPNPIGAPPAAAPTLVAYPNYLADQTNNPYHGFEASKIPNFNQSPGAPAAAAAYNPQNVGGMPIDVPTVGTNFPTTYPTYNASVNSSARSDGENEADELNLYRLNPLLDSPFGPSDLEWLYRQQDVDGATLTSRLAQLAPVSFTNTIDSLRRRRLVSLDSWESNNFAWANDNPQGVFANNARFTPVQSPSFGTLGLPTPALAHRDKKINLNYPLPVSNDPNEPIRQKWIANTYQLLKSVLPPDAVDTAEELAQLSQFVINIIDFRDPDATMTHFVNPDVVLNPGTVVGAVYNPPTLTINVNNGNLDQYGMEYNPVAINETLAYTFQSQATGALANASRFFIELVNTLSAAYNPAFSAAGTAAGDYYGNASVLSLGGFNYTTAAATGDPYAYGCWDLVFTPDNPVGRPDPFRGELVYPATGSTAVNYYSIIPLTRDALGTGAANPAAPNSGDVTLLPVNPAATVVTTAPVTPPATATTPPTTYYYVIGNPGVAGTEYNQPAAASSITAPNVTQTLVAAYNPMAATANPPGSTAPFKWRDGILPVAPNTPSPQAGPPAANYRTQIGIPTAGSAQYYWVSLRRPANPFAPVSATNPMCVVDSMRFPYVDGTGANFTATDGNGHPCTQGPYNTIYSAQRLQPYRGGHAVPVANATGAPPAGSAGPVKATTPAAIADSRYGFADQIAVPQNIGTANKQSNFGIFVQYTDPTTNALITNPATNLIYSSLGSPNDSAENWDYLPFHDRDFTSVAELLLVPGCPPGLFTKQFVENAPSMVNAANIFSQVTPVITPNFSNAGATAYSVGTPAYPTTLGNPTAGPTPAGGTPPQGGNLATANNPAPFATATVPFLNVAALTTQNYSAAAPITPFTFTGANPYVQPMTVTPNTVLPHTFPYLVDRFFYTGASSFFYPPTQGNTDPSVGNAPVVGGPASDGWFKMFEFVEVPSQMMGAIGPVASGANFDWARQDSKPGLLNINLIIDEEVFFSVFGKQAAAFAPPQVTFMGTTYPGGSYQNQLNSIQLPSILNANGLLPYTFPLSSWTNGAPPPAQPVPPIPVNGSPVPLVVSAIQANGAPNYVYPITNPFQLTQHGFVDNDPVLEAINIAAIIANPLAAQPPPADNRLKAAFAQFLWLRHGGSGYLFGFGNGPTGANSAVVTPSVGVNTGPLPAERYFHSLSYPDINYTVMRPAALPPSISVATNNYPASNPALLPDANSTNPQVVAVDNAKAMLYQPTAAPTTWYWLNANVNALPFFYAPYVTNANFAATAPVVYTGDPGVRNPLLSQGYVTAAQPAATSPYPITGANTVPAGVPLPVNVAFPALGAGAVPTMNSVALPPPIPAARLFQVPDAYGAGGVLQSGYTGITTATTLSLPPALSNATDSGDPWLNNQVPTTPVQAVAAGPPYFYALNNGFTSLIWPDISAGGGLVGPPAVPPPNVAPRGAEYGATGSPGSAPIAATGVLPLIALANGPAAATPLQIPDRYLGTTPTKGTDDRQHPYWRSEMLQKAMNLTTVRTHQFAVWITVGFFEVQRQGDIGMLAQGNPQLAFDILGSEIGSVTGTSIRYRGFFLVDRLKLTSFDPANTGSFRAAVVYRKVIQ